MRKRERGEPTREHTAAAAAGEEEESDAMANRVTQQQTAVHLAQNSE